MQMRDRTFLSRLAHLVFSPFYLLLTTLCAAGGCAAVVHPPATLVDPVPVYLAQYHVHSTVLFPSEGRFIDYSFGDWNYAALHHRFINDAIGALTVSGESTLERRVVDADRQTGEPLLRDKPDLVIRLYANRQAVEQRFAELTERFQRDLVLHRDDGVMTYGDQAEVFVKDDQHYSLMNNCNGMTAETLRALGFRVDGPIMSSRFHLCAPQADAPRTQANHVAVNPG
jgi:hypothetical protein